MVEYGHKIEEEVKAIKSEIKQNIQGTSSEGKETGAQINGLEQMEKTNIQNGMKKEEFKKRKNKMKRGLGTSRTTLNVPTSES